jgi:hypothetical protein
MVFGAAKKGTVLELRERKWLLDQRLLVFKFRFASMPCASDSLLLKRSCIPRWLQLGWYYRPEGLRREVPLNAPAHLSEPMKLERMRLW